VIVSGDACHGRLRAGSLTCHPSRVLLAAAHDAVDVGHPQARAAHDPGPSGRPKSSIRPGSTLSSVLSGHGCVAASGSYHNESGPSAVRIEVIELPACLRLDHEGRGAERALSCLHARRSISSGSMVGRDAGESVMARPVSAGDGGLNHGRDRTDARTALLPDKVGESAIRAGERAQVGAVGCGVVSLQPNRNAVTATNIPTRKVDSDFGLAEQFSAPSHRGRRCLLLCGRRPAAAPPGGCGGRGACGGRG
jgi:hypothetical protein